MIKKIFSNTIVILILAVIVGIIAGFFVPEGLMKSVLVIKQVSGQVIFFLVPLIIIGFVAPSIALLRGSVSRLIIFAFSLAYLSSVGAAFFAMLVGYQAIPLLDVQTITGSLRELPELLFNLEIPPVLNVMSALLLSIFVGLGCCWTKSDAITELLLQFREIVLQLVRRILVPLLPFYVAANFCAISYEGNISRLGILLPVILIVIVCHYIWLLLHMAFITLRLGNSLLEKEQLASAQVLPAGLSHSLRNHVICSYAGSSSGMRTQEPNIRQKSLGLFYSSIR